MSRNNNDNIGNISNNIGTLRQYFPTLSPSILEEEQRVFENKMHYLNVMLADQEKYRTMFPHIPDAILKSYYFELLDKLDIYRTTVVHNFPHLNNIPRGLFLKIFQYLDFLHLVRFAMTNSILYKHVNTFLFFKSRITWEREHSKYIAFCIFEGRYEDIVFNSNNPIEDNYKNQIILRRYLQRINPPDDHPLHDYSSFSVFKTMFKKVYEKQFKFTDLNLYNNIIAKSFDLLRENDRRKYEHAASIAKRYGFIYCFRTINWTVTQDVLRVKWCREQVIIDFVTEKLGKKPTTGPPKKKPTISIDDALDLTHLTLDNDDLTLVLQTPTPTKKKK